MFRFFVSNNRWQRPGAEQSFEVRERGIVGATIEFVQMQEDVEALCTKLNVLDKAADILGSQEAAETWFNSTQPRMDGRRPLDLIGTSEGAEVLEALLIRLNNSAFQV